MELIPASKFTIEELTDIYNRTRLDYLVPMPMTVRRLKNYFDVYDIDHEGSAVAVLDGKLVGLGMLGLRYKRAWLTRLGVIPEARGHSLGRKLMEFRINYARKRGVSTVFLEVIEGNEPAHRVFRKIGFKETHRLLILRRPPGPVSELGKEHTKTVKWIEEKELIMHSARSRPKRSWTNQVESFVNAGKVEGLMLINHTEETAGYLSYRASPLQLKRVTVGSLNGNEKTIPVKEMLCQLHHRYPLLDTITENIPAAAPYIDAFYKLGYVESFARVAMRLEL